MSEKEKFKKLFDLNEDIINEEEEKISTTSIILDDQTPKGYFKTYKLGITATTLEDQVINSRNIIKETLQKDLKRN